MEVFVIIDRTPGGCTPGGFCYPLLEGFCVKDFIWSGVSELSSKDFFGARFGFLSRCRWYDVCPVPELVVSDVVVCDSPKRQSCVIRLLGFFICHFTPLVLVTVL
ncbi:hypothetical protein [Chifec microvirus UA13_14]|nr:hypothetical protein [Chifec microvirus UA13_14]